MVMLVSQYIAQFCPWIIPGSGFSDINQAHAGGASLHPILPNQLREETRKLCPGPDCILDANHITCCSLFLQHIITANEIGT